MASVVTIIYILILVTVVNMFILFNISRSLGKIELILSLQIKNLDKMLKK